LNLALDEMGVFVFLYAGFDLAFGGTKPTDEVFKLFKCFSLSSII